MEENKQKEKGKLIERTCKSEYAVSQLNVQNIDEIDGKHDWWYCQTFFVGVYVVLNEKQLGITFDVKSKNNIHIRTGGEAVDTYTYTYTYIQICAHTQRERERKRDRQTYEMLEDQTNGFYFGEFLVRICF